MKKNYCTVLSIAGSDCSGGAGIQADIKTISAIGCYAASVITILTAQNTQGVTGIQELSNEFISEQLRAVFDDLTVDAVKIGMLYSEAVVDRVVESIDRWQPKSIVLDPVMVAESGANLIRSSTLEYMMKNLFQKVSLITPNKSEAECITGARIKTIDDAKRAAKKIGCAFSNNVLVKGGDIIDEEHCTDILYLSQEDIYLEYQKPRINTKNTHGTGCTLSSAIASYLAQGVELAKAVGLAKEYLYQAIVSGAQYRVGDGNGPVDHNFSRP